MALRTVTPQLVYLLSLLIGVLSGSVALLLLRYTDRLYTHLFSQFGQFDQLLSRQIIVWPWDWHWQTALVCGAPIVGALLTGLLARYVDPDVSGGGTEQLLTAFHERDGMVKARTPWAKVLATFLTIGTGGSGGKEGPMLLVGGGLGSTIAQLLRVGPRARRTLLLAGAAAGLGAVFRIPLAGAIIAVEVLYTEDFESDALIPCLIASITAYSMVSFFHGTSHVFWAIPQQPPSVLVFLLFGVLAGLCALVGVGYIRLSHAMKAFFDRLRVEPVWLKPVAGACALSALLLFVPQMAGSGIDVVQLALSNGFVRDAWYVTVGWCAWLALCKMVASAVSIQSGGSAGTLIPCVFIGAMLGGVVGQLGQALWPAVAISTASFMVVGMAGMLSSVTKASLGALIMACELTGGYELLPYLMGVCIIILLTTRRHSLYRHQRVNRFASAAHAWEVQHTERKPVSVAPEMPV